MPRNKDPAVLFYTSDFLAGTMLMTNEQKGKYITLLCLQHLNGHLSKEDMLTVCGKQDEKIFSKFSVDEDGNYYNERMDREVKKRANYEASRVENGSKGGRPKKANENHMVSENETIEKPRAIGNGNGNITEDKDITKNSISIPFPTTTTTTDSTTTISDNSFLCSNGYAQEKAEDALESMCGFQGNVEGKPVGYYGITEDEEKWIVEYFIENEFKSNPREFIAYNASRGWRGIGGENVRAHLLRYMIKWERGEK